jgi:hypothetical protein
MRCNARRALATLSDIGSVHGNSRKSSAGVDSGAKLRMRKSSVCGGIFNLSQVPVGGQLIPAAQKSRQVLWRLSGVLRFSVRQTDRDPSSASGFG